MLLKCFWLVITILSFTDCMAGNIVINGNVPSFAGKVVSVNEYRDFISMSKQVIVQVSVDSAGFFMITLKNIKGSMINLEIENLSLDIYVSDTKTYMIAEKENKIVLREESGISTNKILADLDRHLRDNWAPLFIDLKTQDFKDGNSPESILLRLNKIEQSYLSKPDSLLRSLAYYKVAYYKLFYFDISTPVLTDELNKFEDEFFNKKAIQLTNPLYVRLLEYYLTVRVRNIQYSRSGRGNDMLAALIAEADFFKSPLLKQLAMVVAVKMVFRFPLSVTQKNKILDDVKGSMRHRNMEPGVKDILERVILMSERWKVGDIFPTLSLRNVNGLMDSITATKSDLILIDFWATWCFACVEGMNKFNDWISQSKGKLTIVCISVDSDFRKMKEFVDKKQFSSSIRVLYNGDQGNYFNRVPIQGLPTYYLLNGKGEILDIPPVADSIPGSLKKSLINIYSGKG